MIILFCFHRRWKKLELNYIQIFKHSYLILQLRHFSEKRLKAESRTFPTYRISSQVNHAKREVDLKTLQNQYEMFVNMQKTFNYLSAIKIRLNWSEKSYLVLSKSNIDALNRTNSFKSSFSANVLFNVNKKQNNFLIVIQNPRQFMTFLDKNFTRSIVIDCKKTTLIMKIWIIMEVPDYYFDFQNQFWGSIFV